MKITVEEYFEWSDEDGTDRVSTADELNEIFDDEEWPEIIAVVYHVGAGTLYIGSFVEKEVADMVAALLSSKGGRRKIEEVMTVRKLTEHN